MSLKIFDEKFLNGYDLKEQKESLKRRRFKSRYFI